ncbi:MAG: transcription-repair coupling factor [Lachnospiraceae bacterium]|nr:transcription-repair coupling factor [Lachnospiraceae bacterium]
MNSEILNKLKGIDELEKNAKTAISKGKTIKYQVCGPVDTGRVHMMSKAGDGFKYKIITTFCEQKAQEIYEDMKFFDKNVFLYPAKDFIFYSADMQSGILTKNRLAVRKAVAIGEEATIITTIDGLMDKIPTKEKLRENFFVIENGSIIEPEAISRKLVNFGYERVSQVEMPGQFAIRGSIIDIFPPTEESPYRIDLWDDEVDSVRTFDKDSQRAIENVDSVWIFPATEFVLTSGEIEEGVCRIKKDLEKYVKSLDKNMKIEEAHRIKLAVNEFLEQIDITTAGVPLDSYVNYFYEETVSLIDYFNPEETIVLIDETGRMTDRMEAVVQEFKESMINRLEKGYVLPGQTGVVYEPKEIYGKIQRFTNIHFTTLDQKIKHFTVDEVLHISMMNINAYNSSFDVIVKDLNKYCRNKYRTVIISSSKTRAERLAENLYKEYDLPAVFSVDRNREPIEGEIFVSYGNIHGGYEYPDAKFVVIAESDIFGKEKKKRKKSKYTGQKISDFSKLNIGDYVVHENHGLGVYRGIEKIEVDKTIKDYIKIEYAAGGNLYILATQLDLLQKYAGSEAKAPKLNKLGTKEWGNTKTRVKKAVKDIAGELVELYAKRQSSAGHPCGPDTLWQQEFEEMFPYEETDDQLVAIEETKKDMESRKIMDRLICGDVGFGKTEIAIRAAFKAVQEGMQVVFLVPTTILAQQHYNTFVQRMKDFPVHVEMLSRFRTKGQIEKAVEGIKGGYVDIVIGTHRVLSKDVQFKKLGLLIIDEEQRFGVADKEKIKQLKSDVDVLTLTATPIPRTLHMSLAGIRDMSVLEEPPVDRMPIQTYVMEYNDEMVREAINRELARGGQVYYVYNRVNSIEDITSRIAALVPDATVAYAHGQMSERKLEQIMYDFINKDIDVLVSTTIIETGLDISNANTMIIHDSDKMGLSQLYQLRGRIGRSNRTAYAFLMYKRDKMLKEVAEKRLQAIREFTELGSGFKIAMRDLELRGAGNVLGAEQHGHMEAVGYDLYCKLLNEAVNVAKGVEEHEDFETTVDVDVDAYIPSKYIANEEQKLAIYRKIAAIENEEEYDDMLDELIDRFGEPQRAVTNLLKIALLKAKAHKVYVSELSGDYTRVKLEMYPAARINTARIADFMAEYKNHMTFTAEANPYFTYRPARKIKDFDEYVRVMTEMFEKMQNMLMN